MPTTSTLTYGDGWFPEEQDGRQSYRWMGLTACCRATGLPPAGQALVRVTAGLWGSQAVPPVLSVAVNGRAAGAATVSAGIGRLVFPADCAETLDIQLTLDRTFSVPDDDRVLGLMVRSVEVLAAADLEQPVDADGWFDWEYHEYFPFRWMGQSSRVVVPAAVRARGRFAQLPVTTDYPDGEQVLTVSDGGTVLATLPLLQGWHVYDLELAAEGGPEVAAAGQWLSFSVNKLRPADALPPDPRQLGVRAGSLEVHDDRRRHELVARFHEALRSEPAGRDAQHRDGGDGLPVEGDGWYWTEYDDDGRPFRWMKQQAALRIEDGARQGARYCVLSVFSSFRNLKQELTVLAEGVPLKTFPLLKAWSRYSIELPPTSGRDLVLELRVNRVTPAAGHEGDRRQLAVRVADVSFHDDARRHERQAAFYHNAVRNQQELQEGATTLQSFPSLLGIDLYGKCNIKPPCVYCLWDPMKVLEGDQVNAVVDASTLESYGGFFWSASQLVNCSFGEPLLHPDLEGVLDFLARNDKVTELSTNGQAFNPRTVKALAGKRIHLYVSLDSATAATYGRLRNERWHEVVAGLLFLRRARRRNGGWPRLNLVFMPMRANREDLEMYFRLCQLVEADQLVLRPLMYLENPRIERERGGYRFVYERELLGEADLQAIFAECAAHAPTYQVRVVSQFDFGKIEAPAIGDAKESA